MLCGGMTGSQAALGACSAMEHIMKPLLDLNDLAALLRRSPHTIKRNLRTNPDAVPPRLQLPGTKLLRWRQEDVQAWLAANVQSGGRR